jgi:hypothetical protein
MTTPTVQSLQRELLAVIKGRDGLATWARVNGMPLSERVSLRAGINKSSRVRELRLAIHALNPAALLYWSWHGGEQAEAEFAGLVARARAVAADERDPEQRAAMDDTMAFTGASS